MSRSTSFTNVRERFYASSPISIRDGYRPEFPLHHRTRKWIQANSDSQQMYVRNLLVNDTHYDKHLILHIFAHVLEIFKMQVPASTEDELGKVEQFSIYHCDHYRWLDDKVCAGWY
jgi:hypothetical protein